MSMLRLSFMALMAALASTAQAADRPLPSAMQGSTAASQAAARVLSPAQIQLIRTVGRHVLAAKKSGAEDGDDAAQLSSLRASLDRLIAADLDPKNRAPITVQGHENDEQRSRRETVAGLREAARADARALAAQLRGRSELKASRMQGRRDGVDASDGETRSAGLPVGEQRAKLFERWSHRLDAALADDNPDRTTQLRELRDQLRPTKGRLSEAPMAHGTPTLQAMPAGYVPPKGTDATNKSNEK